MIAGRANPTQIPVKPPVLAAKPPEPSVAELLASAERSFASGDDQAAVDFCSRILSQKAGIPPRAQSAGACRGAAVGEPSARGAAPGRKGDGGQRPRRGKRHIGRAREIDPSSPLIRAVEAKLDALERAERARMEQLKSRLRHRPRPRRSTWITTRSRVRLRTLLSAARRSRGAESSAQPAPRASDADHAGRASAAWSGQTPFFGAPTTDCQDPTWTIHRVLGRLLSCRPPSRRAPFRRPSPGRRRLPRGRRPIGR